MSALARIVGGKTAATRAERERRAPGQLDTLHETGTASITPLLQHVVFEGGIHEPACGRLAIARVLAAHGHDVTASDVVDYGLRPSEIPRGVKLLKPVDFRAIAKAVRPNIVSNFPFDDMGSERLAAHGLELLAAVPRRAGQTRKLALFHKMRFLESARRDALLDNPLWAGVLALTERQPMLHRHGWNGAKLDDSPEFYGWFVFDLDNPRPPGVDAWIRRV